MVVVMMIVTVDGGCDDDSDKLVDEQIEVILTGISCHNKILTNNGNHYNFLTPVFIVLEL